MHIAICDDDSRLAAEPNGVVITSGGAGSGVGVRGVSLLPSHLRRTHLCLNQSPAGLLPLLRRDSGVRCIVQRGSHRQLLAEEAV